ncbi:uncharacterized protein GGS25DRAFT_526678 [Hypoxylon fragiforme]|uniref:uncharacterized protein n=1 Tax=Hypoxylon fragiforme TaxID=63214 RepID=UPI0020C72202|nr:uncharacterized protein GGS25DRAFT_526678 [Hypoxylon fragiforme]KAI2613480.1 hypothetical protein GGS25DRAFT_526678 [Hypoxylon fragiforme]
MKFKQVLVLLLSLASVDAAPPVGQEKECRLHPEKCKSEADKAKDNETKEKQRICRLPSGTAEQREYIWSDKGGGVGKFLEDWLKKNGEEKWFSKMDYEFSPSGTKYQNTCNTLGGSICSGPGECMDFKRAEFYWIRMAGQRTQATFNYLYTWLRINTVQDSILINKIVAAFGDPKPKDHSQIPAIFAAILIISGGYGGAAGSKMGPTSIFGVGAINVGINGKAVAESNHKAIDSEQTVSDTLSTVFSQGMSGLESTLALALAGTFAGNKKMTTKDLPGSGGSYSSPISNFFDKGRALVGDIDTVYSPLVKKWDQSTKRAMSVAILKEQRYFVFINTDIKSSADCFRDGAKRIWHGNDCLDIWRFTDNDKLRGDGAQGETVNHMLEPDFGAMDLGIMYNNALDCATQFSKGDGKVDTSKIKDDGHTPLCLYNFPVVKGKIHIYVRASAEENRI